MPRRAGGIVVPLLLLVVAAGSVAAYFYAFRTSDRGIDSDAILHEVTRKDFVLDITERGEVESAGVTEVVSEVKTKNTAGLAILKIVPEGTEVQPGDFLVELDSSALKEELTTQQILVNTSEALVVEARNIFETAEIAKQEYIEGTYVQERQTIESEVFVAEENLNRAKEYYAYSKRLAAKGYVNELQLEADKFAVEKSKKELDAALTKLRVLDDFTRAKMQKQLESDVVTAKAKWQAEEKSHELDLQKLREIEDQVAKCMIAAPKAGVVTYAHDRDRRGDTEFVVEPGAVVRERQAIVRLPDPSQMQVEVTINESMIQFIRTGIAATIRPVGIDGVVLHGRVTKVNRYAEASGWRQANVKEYKAFVSLDQTNPELRSGMTTSVTIHAVHLPDALLVPVQSVYAHGRDQYCIAIQDSGWVARKVECGPTNDKYFIINDGLDAGDRIAMNPRRYLDQVALPKLSDEDLDPSEQLEGAPDFETSGLTRVDGGATVAETDEPAATDPVAAESSSTDGLSVGG